MPQEKDRRKRIEEAEVAPLEDCVYALQDVILQLARSSLHRFHQRYGVFRLTDVKSEAEPKRKFESYRLGLHIGISGMHTEEGKLRLFDANNRGSRFAFVRLKDSRLGHSIPATARYDRGWPLPDS